MPFSISLHHSPGLAKLTNGASERRSRASDDDDDDDDDDDADDDSAVAALTGQARPSSLVVMGACVHTPFCLPLSSSREVRALADALTVPSFLFLPRGRKW